MLKFRATFDNNVVIDAIMKFHMGCAIRLCNGEEVPVTTEDKANRFESRTQCC